MEPNSDAVDKDRLSRVTLRQLEYFRSIASTGSIAAAAEQQHVSRSAVAAALTELERIFGSQLCTRHKSHGVELTAAGLQLRDRAVAILIEVGELEQNLSGEALSGPLSFGCFSSLAPTVLPGMLRLMSEKHPDVDADFTVSTDDVMLERMWAGELEFIISYDMSLDRSLATETLYETRMHVILAGDHPLAALAQVPAKLLQDEPLILLETPPSADDILGYLHRQGVAPRIRHRTSHFELTRSLVGAGLGYSVFVQVPRSGLSYEGRPVAVRPLDPPPPLKRAEIAWPVGRNLTARAKAFIRLALSSTELYLPEAVYPPEISE